MSEKLSGQGARITVGWRESVALPSWGIDHVIAKIDTGARTSAIHVEDVRELRDGRVRFHVVLDRNKPINHVPVTADVVRKTVVRSSTGHVQRRYVVSTRMRLGSVSRRVELSLVRREHMLCRMLLGRKALEGLLVDVTRKYILSEQPRRRKAAKKVAKSAGKPKKK